MADDELAEWVCCDYCSKWRELPECVSASSLPEVWTCSLATWKADGNKLSCLVPEAYAEPHGAAPRKRKRLVRDAATIAADAAAAAERERVRTLLAEKRIAMEAAAAKRRDQMLKKLELETAALLRKAEIAQHQADALKREAEEKLRGYVCETCSKRFDRLPFLQLHRRGSCGVAERAAMATASTPADLITEGDRAPGAATSADKKSGFCPFCHIYLMGAPFSVHLAIAFEINCGKRPDCDRLRQIINDVLSTSTKAEFLRAISAFAMAMALTTPTLFQLNDFIERRGPCNGSSSALYAPVCAFFKDADVFVDGRVRTSAGATNGAGVSAAGARAPAAIEAEGTITGLAEEPLGGGKAEDPDSADPTVVAKLPSTADTDHHQREHAQLVDDAVGAGDQACATAVLGEDDCDEFAIRVSISLQGASIGRLVATLPADFLVRRGLVHSDAAATARKLNRRVEKPYVCEENGCTFAVSERGMLGEHMRRAHPVFRCTEPNCGYVTNFADNADSHRTAHTDLFLCEGCGFVTERRSRFDAHVCKYVSQPLNAAATAPSPGFSGRVADAATEHAPAKQAPPNEHKDHLFIDAPLSLEGTRSCPVDGCTFSTRGNLGPLRNHMNFKHPERCLPRAPSAGDRDRNDGAAAGSSGRAYATGLSQARKLFACVQVGCGDTFMSSDMLHRHIRVEHADVDSLFFCKEERCQFVTTYREDLDTHTLEHVDLHVCEVDGCGFAAVRRSQLAAHMRTHANSDKFHAAQRHAAQGVTSTNADKEKLYECDKDGCEFATVQRDALVAHSRSHAFEDKEPSAAGAGADGRESAAFTFKIALEQLNSLLADKTISYDQYLAGMKRLRDAQ